MNAYVHKVHYYETDRMGITHHPIISAGWRKPEWIFLTRRDGDLTGWRKKALYLLVISRGL